jgi:hypothetical protein
MLVFCATSILHQALGFATAKIQSVLQGKNINSRCFGVVLLCTYNLWSLSE